MADPTYKLSGYAERWLNGLPSRVDKDTLDLGRHGNEVHGPGALGINFNPDKPAGIVNVVEKTDEGLWVEAVTHLDLETLELFPVFAIAVRTAGDSSGDELIKDAELLGVSVCSRNMDPDLPRYGIEPIPS